MTTTDAEYREAEGRWLRRNGVEASAVSVPAPTISGRAHVLVTGSGPPAVLLIGAAVPAAMWAPLMARLPGRTLHAVDLPSHGLTSRTSPSTAHLRPAMTGFILDVLDGLGLDRAVLVAQSMAGLFASWTAAEHPERVAGISYVGCPAFVLGTSAPLPLRLLSIRPLGRLITRMRPSSPRQAESFAAVAGEDFGPFPELRDLVIALQSRPGYADDLVMLLHSVLTLRGARPQTAFTAEMLRRIPVPTQFVWGEADTFGSPSIGRRASELAPRSEFHLVPGGHAPWLDDPEAVARPVGRFIDRHAGRPTRC
jgi:2-hydroxy-6-oxonona-2,4-dienedioate hydrolase/4,5:9,10-diseco-3-hydroxy-5,9,17-trioxoandrosta-1(10),2-diene-4-oate hydrolase